MIETLFADTYYWIALIDPKDKGHTRALSFERQLGNNVRLLTSEDVLGETLTAFSRMGSQFRVTTAVVVRRLFWVGKEIEILPRTTEDFIDALGLYTRRPDKQYSFVDCLSMVQMTRRGLTRVLTHDRHFAQEGFLPLL